MNFEQRKNTARDLVVEFLNGFVPPRGMDDSQLAMRVSQIADAFARRMPDASNYGDLVQSVLDRILDTHMSNTWPAQGAFVMAMPNKELSKFSSPETYEPKDPHQVVIDAMEASEPVAESALWGVFSGSLPRNQLERYRNASVSNWINMYGPDAPRLMRARYGEIVGAYLPEVYQ